MKVRFIFIAKHKKLQVIYIVEIFVGETSCLHYIFMHTHYYVFMVIPYNNGNRLGINRHG